jgi:hypothetical protein
MTSNDFAKAAQRPGIRTLNAYQQLVRIIGEEEELFYSIDSSIAQIEKCGTEKQNLELNKCKKIILKDPLYSSSLAISVEKALQSIRSLINAEKALQSIRS